LDAYGQALEEANSNKNRSLHFQFLLLKMDEKNDLEKINNQVFVLIKKYNETYYGLVKKRLSYYEWEISL